MSIVLAAILGAGWGLSITLYGKWKAQKARSNMLRKHIAAWMDEAFKYRQIAQDAIDELERKP